MKIAFIIAVAAIVAGCQKTESVYSTSKPIHMSPTDFHIERIGTDRHINIVCLDGVKYYAIEAHNSFAPKYSQVPGSNPPEVNKSPDPC